MLPSGRKNFLNPGSMSVRISAMRGAIAMKTSLLGSSLGILAFRYALPMSSEMTCLPSAAASWAKIRIAEVLAVGEEVSMRLYRFLSWPSPPPTSRAFSLSLILPCPSLDGAYFCVTFI